MPWTCKSCDTTVEQDDMTCPRCSTAKSAWTMVNDQTRAFTIARARFEVLRGVGGEPAPPPGAEAPPPERIEATSAPVVSKAAAAGWAAEGLAPAEADVLTTRLFPKKGSEWPVELVVEFAADAAEPHDFAVPAPEGHAPGAPVDLRVLLVWGPEETPANVPEVDRVVDVTEEGADGALSFAPQVSVKALRRPAVRLPVRRRGSFHLAVRFFGRSGRVPAADLACTVAGRSATSDGQGLLRLDGVEPGYHRVELEGGAVMVPATHHPALVTRIALPFVGESEAELAEHPRRQPAPEDAAPQDVEPPTWLPHELPEAEEDDEDDGDDGDEDLSEEEFDAVHGDRSAGDDDELYDLAVRVVGRRSGAPAANATCTVDGRTVRTDAQGVLRVAGVGPGYHLLELEGGAVRVPASHHPDLLVRVYLPRPDEEEAARPTARPPAGDAEPARVDPPAWLPIDPEAASDDDDDGDDDDDEAPDEETFDATHGDRGDLADLADLLE